MRFITSVVNPSSGQSLCLGSLPYRSEFELSSYSSKKGFKMVVIFPENSAVGSSENIGGPILIDCLLILLSSFLYLSAKSGEAMAPLAHSLTTTLEKSGCEFNYCNDGNHNKCEDGIKCENNDKTLIKKLNKSNRKSNQFLKCALTNCMRKRFIQEEQRTFLGQNNLPIKLVKKTKKMSKLKKCDTSTAEVKEMKKFSALGYLKSLPLIRMLLIIF